MKIAATCLAACFAFASTANAAAIFEITEAYIGVSGPDGTEDWFELTNVGNMSGSTGGLYYDDDSNDPTKDSALSAFTLAPGESAIFLIDSNGGSDITDFETIWGTGINVGFTGDAGALSGGGDTLYVYDSNLPGANTVDTVSYDGSFENTLKTIEFLPNGTALNSVDGVNGAYESNSFFNDNESVGGEDELATLIGSPGSAPNVPEPSAGLMLVVAGLITTVRRR